MKREKFFLTFILLVAVNAGCMGGGGYQADSSPQSPPNPLLPVGASASASSLWGASPAPHSGDFYDGSSMPYQDGQYTCTTQPNVVVPRDRDFDYDGTGHFYACWDRLQVKVKISGTVSAGVNSICVFPTFLSNDGDFSYLPINATGDLAFFRPLDPDTGLPIEGSEGISAYHQCGGAGHIFNFPEAAFNSLIIVENKNNNRLNMVTYLLLGTVSRPEFSFGVLFPENEMVR